MRMIGYCFQLKTSWALWASWALADKWALAWIRLPLAYGANTNSGYSIYAQLLLLDALEVLDQAKVSQWLHGSDEDIRRNFDGMYAVAGVHLASHCGLHCLDPPAVGPDTPLALFSEHRANCCKCLPVKLTSPERVFQLPRSD